MCRRLGLRYLCRPRPSTGTRRRLQEYPNPETGLYNFRHGYTEPWYIRDSHPRQSDPSKYRAAGYSLDGVGPLSQEGKGIAEMDVTVKFLKSYDRTGCPFA